MSVAVIGSFVQDLAFRVESFASSGETRIGEFVTGPGGKGSNQAVACHRQGVNTVFIGAVGEDLFAKGYRAWSESEGLKTRLLTVTTAPTGAASIIVNSRAENQIVVALGANDALTPDFVISALEDAQSLSVMLLQAESNLGAAERALRYARDEGLFSIFNPAPINPGVTPDLLSLAECITPNETECSYLIEKFTGRKCVAEGIARLSDGELKTLCRNFPVASVLITLGEHGSILYQKEAPHARIKGITTDSLVRIPSLAIVPIDTTGAGDAFNGGLAAGLVKFEGDLLRSMRYATVVAGLSTLKHGTAPAMPRASEVEKFSEFYS